VVTQRHQPENLEGDSNEHENEKRKRGVGAGVDDVGWTERGDYSPGSGKPERRSESVLKMADLRRDEIRIKTEDRIVMDSYKNMDGQETKVMEIVAIRKKKLAGRFTAVFRNSLKECQP
jgi:hypothetical protein